jgi:D-alanyl-lipoteichoic acid acyltransferase DltB (MBOAT superfamily)
MLAILIVFNVSGLWHGASLTFVVWGLLHGIYIIAERFVFPNAAAKSLVRPVIVFIFVTAAWVFFRATSFEDAFYVFANAFRFEGGGFLSIPSISVSSFLTSAGLIVFLLAAEWLQYKGYHRAVLSRDLGILRPAYVINFLLLCSILFLGIFEEQSFIYFQF